MDDFQTWTRRTARKPKRCESCRSSILPGQAYRKYAGKSDGDFYSMIMHEDCAGLREELADTFDPDNEGMDPDMVEEIAAAGISAREVDDILNSARGFYPHAVCRLEYRMRNWWSR